MHVRAYAKVNLSLDVPSKRPDGYHDIRSVMATVSLCDELRIERAAGGISIGCDLPYLPRDGRNHAAKAARAFMDAAGVESGLRIDIKKRIPVCAGMGGGSADAAAVIIALNRLFRTGYSAERLMEIGRAIGSDVPFCILGGVALAEGLGEILTPLPPLPPCYMVVCKPRVSHSTPEFYARLDAAAPKRRPDTAGLLTAISQGDLPELCRRMYNVFSEVLDRTSPCREAEAALLSAGALGAAMTGTGSAVIGVFPNESAAQSAAKAVKQTGYTTVCTPRPQAGQL